MKQLIILRHAKAVSKRSAQDFDRVLAEEGRREMGLIAAAIRAESVRPDLALVSPAARARETWTLARIEGLAPRFEQAIYDASLETLVALLRGVPEASRSPMLVGHNPGLEGLAEWIAAPGTTGLERGLPTAALVAFGLPDEPWAELAEGTGRLTHLATPASLEPQAG